MTSQEGIYIWKNSVYYSDNMPREAVAQVTRGVLKVGETPQVKSSLKETTWQGVSDVGDVANIISVVMSPSYVDELLNGRNGGYWRFVSSERIQELLDLGEPDEYDRLYFKIVREGREKGLYLIDRGQWERTAPKDSLTLHVSSIKEAIKQGWPLAVVGDYDFIWDRDRLDVNGYYVGYGAARVAQNEAAGVQFDKKDILRGLDELQRLLLELRRKVEEA